MRHRKPARYCGQHRSAALTPRTRYGIVVGTALVGAGVIAFGVGTTLPQPSSHAAAEMEMKQAEGGEGGGQPTATVQREPQLARASRTERRVAAPAPEKLPEWTRPANGYISSGYGYRPEFHGGIDFAVPLGSPIFAASSGVVKHAGWYGGYGILIIIDHGDGIVTYYGHNSQALVEPGEHVEAGQVVAKSGSTGQSTGPHSHFEVRINDERVDPAPFLRDRNVDL